MSAAADRALAEFEDWRRARSQDLGLPGDVPHKFFRLSNAERVEELEYCVDLLFFALDELVPILRGLLSLHDGATHIQGETARSGT